MKMNIELMRSKSLVFSLRGLWLCLGVDNKKRFIYLLVLMISSSLLEIISIGAVFHFSLFYLLRRWFFIRARCS